MDGPEVYYAKGNKRGKNQKLYDFIHMRDITKSNKWATKKPSCLQTTEWWSADRKGKVGKGGQIHGKGRKLDSGW